MKIDDKWIMTEEEIRELITQHETQRLHHKHQILVLCSILEERGKIPPKL